MVKFKLKIDKTGRIYIPKEVREEFGTELELYPDYKGGILIPKDTEPSEVLETLHTLEHHFEQMASEKKSG